MTKSLKEQREYTKEEIYSILKVYLKEQMELSIRKCRDEDNFTMPSWSEYQAYQLGTQKAFQKLLDFLP